MKPSAFWIVASVLMLVLTGCSGYKPAPAAFHEALYHPYVLGEGDRIRVTVFEQEGLTNTYTVDQSGHIAFPLIGAVPARGHTVQQMEAMIAQSLQAGFIRNPDVSVEVDQYRPVFVMGEVGGPGQYAYVPGMTVQKAVAAAGGFTARAHQGNADITRQINGNLQTGRVPISDPVMPGDTLYVRERLF